MACLKGIRGKMIKALFHIPLFVIALAFASQSVAAVPQVNIMPGFPLVAGNLVMVMWSPVPGAVKYSIYLDEKKIGEAPAPPFQFATPKDAKEYLVSVAAVDASGGEGMKSVPGKFSIITIDPPKGIEVLRKGDKGETVALRWIGSKGANIYNVFRKDAPDAKFALLGSTQDMIYSDSTVGMGKEYEYAVSAKDVTGKESALSVPVKVKMTSLVSVVKEKVVAVPKRTQYNVIMPTGVDLISPVELRVKGDFLYMLDTGAQRIQKFDLEGKYVSSIGKGGFLPGQFQAPAGFAFLPEGGVAVLDGNTKKVTLLKEDGEHIKTFPIPFETKKKDRKITKVDPVHIAVTKDGNLAVIDGTNRRIVIMTMEGKFVTDFMEEAKGGETGAGFVRSPASIVVDDAGAVYVADMSTQTIHVFNPDYTPKYKIDYPTGPGSFVAPGKMDIYGREKALLVPDGMLATVQGFSLADGKYLFTLTGESGKLEKEQLPIWELGSTRTVSVAPDGSLWVLMALDKAFAHIKF